MERVVRPQNVYSGSIEHGVALGQVLVGGDHVARAVAPREDDAHHRDGQRLALARRELHQVLVQHAARRGQLRARGREPDHARGDGGHQRHRFVDQLVGQLLRQVGVQQALAAARHAQVQALLRRHGQRAGGGRGGLALAGLGVAAAEHEVREERHDAGQAHPVLLRRIAGAVPGVGVQVELHQRLYRFCTSWRMAMLACAQIVCGRRWIFILPVSPCMGTRPSGNCAGRLPRST